MLLQSLIAWGKEEAWLVILKLGTRCNASGGLSSAGELMSDDLISSALLKSFREWASWDPLATH